MDWNNKYYKNVHTTQSQSWTWLKWLSMQACTTQSHIKEVQHNFYQNSSGFFQRNGTNILKFIWNHKKPPDNPSDLEKEQQSWMHHIHWLEIILHSIWSYHFMQIDGETMETVAGFIFLDSKITADGDCSHEVKRHLLLGIKAMRNLENILKIRHYFANKGLSSQSYGFSSSHVWMWELDHKESWVPRNWCFWTCAGKESWESPGLQGDPTSPS